MAPPVWSGFHGLPFGAILHFHVSSGECIHRSRLDSIALRIQRQSLTQPESMPALSQVVITVFAILNATGTTSVE